MKCESLAAKLRHRVTLQGKTTEGDGQGGFAETWADVADLWAGIESLKGWERMQAQQLQTPITHRVLLRYRSGLTTAMRLKYGIRLFDIKEVINEGEANRTLRLMCVETADQTANRTWNDADIAWDDITPLWEELG